MITMHACPSQIDGQTDRQTDEHHGNSATICSTNASRANNTSAANHSSITCKLKWLLTWLYLSNRRVVTGDAGECQPLRTEIFSRTFNIYICVQSAGCRLELSFIIAHKNAPNYSFSTEKKSKLSGEGTPLLPRHPQRFQRLFFP